MVSFLIAYASWSGNTEEVAEMVRDELNRTGIETTMYRIGFGSVPDPGQYDAMLLGSFTWDKGATPEEVKDFVAAIGYKPEPVYVFGTGDTQFGGDDLFCHAAVKLTRFYASGCPPLKIEQSPRGIQEMKVIEWTKGVYQHWLHLHELKC